MRTITTTALSTYPCRIFAVQLIYDPYILTLHAYETLR